jgi:cytochrome c peroxidase
MKHRILFVCALAVVLLLATTSTALALTPIEELGKFLFFDEDLSTPPGQSCATCHDPAAGFTGPDSDINDAEAVYPGAVHTRAGNRKPPTAAYGGDSPVLYYDAADDVWVGGMFWDGRATGWTLGDPLAEQAQGPFLNPLEQNNPNAQLVCFKVAMSSYASLFEEVWGPGSLDPVKDVYGTYERIAFSISAYEQSEEVNPFNSEFDAFWDDVDDADEVAAIDMSNWEDYKGGVLSDDELLGFALFNDEEKGACSLCHTLDPGAAGYPLFTDFTYDNLGVPRNLENPFYDMPKKWNPDGEDWIDPGLGGFLEGAGYEAAAYEAQWGKHKVPTLRNVDARPDSSFVKAYGHNGFFKSLLEITHFYNTRDVEPWPEPEYADTVNTDELGDLGLTAEEEELIVEFMETLTDQ